MIKNPAAWSLSGKCASTIVCLLSHNGTFCHNIYSQTIQLKTICFIAHSGSGFNKWPWYLPFTLQQSGFKSSQSISTWLQQSRELENLAFNWESSFLHYACKLLLFKCTANHHHLFVDINNFCLDIPLIFPASTNEFIFSCLHIIALDTPAFIYGSNLL